jgi:glutathione S-transferase
MNTPLTLIIGNKNYSSWSMRPWVLLRGLDIPFRERQLKFHTQEWDQHIGRLSPSGMVPVLWEGEPGSGFATWDSLAIAERVQDLFPDLAVWPRDPQARARARSLCAEFHSGFRAFRGAMPMNIRSRYPGKGLSPEVEKEIGRIQALWVDSRKTYSSKGPFLFGAFGAADAFFAPVATRFVTYGVELAGAVRDYQQALLGSPGVSAWIAEAVRETEFVAEDEPYATAAR